MENIGNELVLDVFDQDDANEKEFMGRAIIPASQLISNESERSQGVKSFTCPLRLRYDNAKADREIRHIAEPLCRLGDASNMYAPHLGSIDVVADLTLPDPKALTRAIELEEAKRVDTYKNPIQKLRMISRNLAWAQNLLYGVNNTMERVKNMFNWAHPRKTRAVFTLFSFLFWLMLIVPSNYILMFLCLFFLLNDSPLGTMVIKAKHFIALFPTDDDLRDVASGIVGSVKPLPIERTRDEHGRTHRSSKGRFMVTKRGIVAGL